MGVALRNECKVQYPVSRSRRSTDCTKPYPLLIQISFQKEEVSIEREGHVVVVVYKPLHKSQLLLFLFCDKAPMRLRDNLGNA